MRTMGSGYSGAGMFNFSLDWSSVGASGPLYTPYWALGNYFGGLIAVCWVVSFPELRELKLILGRPYHVYDQLLVSYR